MSDLISRQALCEYALNQKDKSVTPNDIMRFPSAQPEKRTQERTETHACDCISRQAAISELMEWVKKEENKSWSIFKGSFHWTGIKAMLECLPSAQPEPTLEQIEEYCHKRCLSIVDNALLHKYAQPEIIRCKDCKYQDENWRRVSVRWLPCMDVRTGSNWYCGSAERGKQNE